MLLIYLSLLAVGLSLTYLFYVVTRPRFRVGDSVQLGQDLTGTITEVFGPYSEDLICVELPNGSFLYVRQSDARKL